MCVCVCACALVCVYRCACVLCVCVSRVFLYNDTHTTLIVNFVQVTLKYMSRVRGVSMRMRGSKCVRARVFLARLSPRAAGRRRLAA